MGRSVRARLPRTQGEPGAAAGKAVLVYAISQRSRIESAIADDANIKMVEFDEFLELSTRQPADLVLSPMVGDTYDCIDVAQHLFAAGFTGSYRVMTPALPNPGILRQEIRSMCPGLDFDLVDLRALSDTALN